MAKFADPDGNIFWLLEAPTGFVRREASRHAPVGPARRRTVAARKSRPRRSGRGRATVRRRGRR